MMATALPRLSLMGYRFVELEQGWEWYLLASPRRDDNRNITAGDPVVERGVAHSEQPRRQVAGDGPPQRLFQGIPHGGHVVVARLPFCPVQPHQVLECPSLLFWPHG